MSSNPLMDPAVRDRLLADPECLLGDTDIMRALIAANDGARGSNVIDLRAVAMERLKDRLERLEETHRTVIAAAYENLAGMNMIHRAILRMLDAADLDSFLRDLGGPVADALRVEALRLIAEAEEGAATEALARLSGSVSIAEPGYCSLYVGTGAGGEPRRVTLRRIAAGDPRLHGPNSDKIRSEACLLLDLGPERLPAMLVLGAADPDQFAPGQGTDLLSFFAAAFERSLVRHMA